MKELLRCIGIGIIAHKDTRCRMVKYGITLIGIAIVESDAEQVRVILKLSRQVKTELPAEKQLIVVYDQWIATWQAWNRFIQTITGHGKGINGGQNFC